MSVSNVASLLIRSEGWRALWGNSESFTSWSPSCCVSSGLWSLGLTIPVLLVLVSPVGSSLEKGNFFLSGASWQNEWDLKVMKKPFRKCFQRHHCGCYLQHKYNAKTMRENTWILVCLFKNNTSRSLNVFINDLKITCLYTCLIQTWKPHCLFISHFHPIPPSNVTFG